MFQNGLSANIHAVDEITVVELKQEVEELSSTRFVLISLYLFVSVSECECT